jgi:hypothetical protein
MHEEYWELQKTTFSMAMQAKIFCTGPENFHVPREEIQAY